MREFVLDSWDTARIGNLELVNCTILDGKKGFKLGLTTNLFKFLVTGFLVCLVGVSWYAIFLGPIFSLISSGDDVALSL